MTRTLYSLNLNNRLLFSLIEIVCVCACLGFGSVSPHCEQFIYIKYQNLCLMVDEAGSALSLPSPYNYWHFLSSNCMIHTDKDRRVFSIRLIVILMPVRVSCLANALNDLRLAMVVQSHRYIVHGNSEMIHKKN